MPSQLAHEAAEAPEAARRQLVECRERYAALAARLRATPPTLVVTCARGSSEHAAVYGKYLLETAAGRVVASIGPSVASAYHAPLALRGALFVTISQSGHSPDLIESARAARAAGALVVGIVNDTASPLAEACEHVLPLCAGEERAVAATKSCLLSKLALLQLAAAWTGDAALAAAAQRAPEALARATTADLTRLAAVEHAYVIGRGLGLGAALEGALKLKETCGLHAEGTSAAEILHGPVALVGAGFPVLAFTQADATAGPMRDVLAKLRSYGGEVLELPSFEDEPAVLAPLCQLQAFYAALPALAAARGLDADQPRHLSKVTQTV